MAKYRGDAGLLREAVAYAGVELYDDKVFSDAGVGTRRLKLWRCKELYDAAPEVQEKFMERLKHNFGNRVIKYFHHISSEPYNFQSFVIVLTEDPYLQHARRVKYAQAWAASEPKRKAKLEATILEFNKTLSGVKAEIEEQNEWVPDQDYKEQMWLRGYQAARRGQENNYAPSINHNLWNEGAKAFQTLLLVLAKPALQNVWNAIGPDIAMTMPLKNYTNEEVIELCTEYAYLEDFGQNLAAANVIRNAIKTHGKAATIKFLSDNIQIL